MNITENIIIKGILNDPIFTIKTLNDNEIETLRVWKNNNKKYFFRKEDIEPFEQEKWYEDVKKNPNDHMFVIYCDTDPIGCMGMRLYYESIDLYNIILGDDRHKGKHVMSGALCALVVLSSFFYPNNPIIVRVLTSNPAIKWYEKNGFIITDTINDHVIMKFDSMIDERLFKLNIQAELTIK